MNGKPVRSFWKDGIVSLGLAIALIGRSEDFTLPTNKAMLE